MRKRGLFIVFEGIDGSGKSTQAHVLMKQIENQNKDLDVLKTHEPWDSVEIKKKLRDDKDAYSDGERMAELYVNDRQMHVERLIRPNLEKGVFVVSDRYWLSTYSYQQTQGVDSQRLIELHQHRGLLTPDITFFVDVPAEVAQERMKERLGLEKFERDSGFIHKLINTYKGLHETSLKDESLYGRIVRIDGTPTPNVVADNIFGHFLELYNVWKESA